jgi:integrase
VRHFKCHAPHDGKSRPAPGGGKRPDDQGTDTWRLMRSKASMAPLEEKMYRKAGKSINQTFFKLRLIVLVALTTGMRIAELLGLNWNDGKMTLRWLPNGRGVQRVSGSFWGGSDSSPEPGAKRGRQRATRASNAPGDDRNRRLPLS